MNSLILNKNVEYNFNPFGGISNEEISKILVPKPFINQIINDIKNPKIKIVELAGLKGRGKTSHLKYLNKEFINSHLILIDSTTNKKTFTDLIDKLLFVDSIHHLNLINRLALYKSNNKIILTTHITRFIEYKLANITYKKYSIKGIEFETLKTVLINRIALSSNFKQKEVKLNDKEINLLIDKFNDDYRAILNFLFDNFKL